MTNEQAERQARIETKLDLLMKSHENHLETHRTYSLLAWGAIIEAAIAVVIAIR